MKKPGFLSTTPLLALLLLALTMPFTTDRAQAHHDASFRFVSDPFFQNTWIKVAPPGEGFYVEMPKAPTLENFKLPNTSFTGEVYHLTNGIVSYAVSSITSSGKSGSARTRLADFVAKYRQALPQLLDEANVEMVFESNLNLNGFTGQQYRLKNVRGLVRIYATEQRIFVVLVAAGDESNPTVSRFLSSFKITERKIVPERMKVEQNINPTIRPGRTDQGERRPNPKGDDRRQNPDNGRERQNPAETCECGTDPEQVINDGKITRNAVLCPKPPLEGTKEADRHRFNGTVKLSVRLNPSGIITKDDIKVTESQPYGLTEAAIASAQQIKFCPALQDGKPVTSYLDLDCVYEFKTIYVNPESPPKSPPKRRRY